MLAEVSSVVEYIFETTNAGTHICKHLLFSFFVYTIFERFLKIIIKFPHRNMEFRTDMLAAYNPKGVYSERKFYDNPPKKHALS